MLRSLRLSLLATGAVATLAVAVAACSSTAAPEPDPVTAVPASATVYLSATLRPHGALDRAAVADARTLTHQADAYAALLGALSLRKPGSPAPRPREVTAWMGERAGLFLAPPAASPPSGATAPSSAAHPSHAHPAAGASALRGPGVEPLALVRHAVSGTLFDARPSGAGAQGAIVLDVRDPAKARRFLRDQSSGEAAGPRTFDGVSYGVTRMGEAYGLVGRFLVMGSEAGMHEVIEAQHGAASLESSSTYRTMRATAPRGALAQLFVSLPGTRATGTLGALANLVRIAGARAGAASALELSLVPQAGRIRIDVDELPQSALPAPSTSESEQSVVADRLFQGLPEGAWAALGVEDLPAGTRALLAYMPRLLGLPGATHQGTTSARGSATPGPALSGGEGGAGEGGTGEAATGESGAEGGMGEPGAGEAGSAEGGTSEGRARTGATGEAGGPHVGGNSRGAKEARTGATGGATPAQAASEPLGAAPVLSALAQAIGPLGGVVRPLAGVASALEAHPAQLRAALSGWIGPAAIFVNGANPLELDAAVVIASRDPARSAAAVEKLGALLRGAGQTVRPVSVPGAERALAVTLHGLPVPLELAAAGARFVAGVGASPVQEALAPPATLGSSSAYRAAAATLGEGLQPRALLEVPTLLAFAGELGLQSNRTFAALAPYLRSLRSLAVGTGRVGALTRTAVVLELQ